jgi:UDP-glucuronate 4-epimerase
MEERARILVTGCAGFIGFHVAKRLLDAGHAVFGTDVLSPYYDVSLKEARLRQLLPYPQFRFCREDLSDPAAFNALLGAESAESVTHIVHLAAQPGVRHSLKAPRDYIRDNVLAHTNVLEYARGLPALQHVVYASSSSVYGANTKQPFAETDPVRMPNSLYAATKGACELISRSYASLYGIPQTGLRFFTVYGPWGRPDMAPYLFTSALFEGRPIRVFNHGRLKRDFTYIDDIASAVCASVFLPPDPNDARLKEEDGQEPPYVPHRVVNVGNNDPVPLMEFIRTLERVSGRTATLVMEEMQKGDVYETYADVGRARELFGFAPKTGLEEGLRAFVGWYREYYGLLPS